MSQHDSVTEAVSVSTCCLFWESEIPYEQNTVELVVTVPTQSSGGTERAQTGLCFGTEGPAEQSCQHQAMAQGSGLRARPVGGAVLIHHLTEEAAEWEEADRAMAGNSCPAPSSQIKLCFSEGRTFNLST